MTLKKRRILFWGSAIFFALAAIPVLLYSFGYRLAPNGLRLLRAGGLDISSIPATGAKVSVDGKFIHETTLFSRRVFLQGLTPRVYHVHIEKDGYYKWDKAVEVLPEKVASVGALLVKNESPKTLLAGDYTDMAFYNSEENLIELYGKKKIRVMFSTKESALTSARAFNTPAATSSAVLSAEIKTLLTEKKPDGFDYDETSRVLWWNKDTLFVRWLEGIDYLPAYTEEIESKIITMGAPIRQAFFYPQREAVLIAAGDSVMVVELDGRVWRNKQELYVGAEPKLLVAKSRKEAYILDKGKLFLVELL